MKFNQLGDTGLSVSEIGFGAFGIGGNKSGNSYGPTDDDTSIAAIHTALDLECNFFDTADVYGYGHSEEIIGKALRQAKSTNNVFIASKVGGCMQPGQYTSNFSGAYISSAINESLQRLNREYIDLYQLHNPSIEVIERGEAFDALEKLKRSGKIRHYGVSIHTTEEGDACINSHQVETLQCVYNLLSFVEPEISMEKIFRSAMSQKIGVIAREPLLAGFLSGKHELSTIYEPGDNRGAWSMERRQVLISLANVLRHKVCQDVTLSQAALRFVLDEPAVSTTIVGVKTPEQVKENFMATCISNFNEILNV